MLQGVDYDNVSSRRAYPLDSRATWVESQHIGGSSKGGHKFVVSKDNRVLGPGEYNPALPTHSRKHIPGPALGGSHGLVDHFHPFKSLLSIRTPKKGDDHQLSMLSYSQGEAAPVYSIANDISRDVFKREGASIFHEHDRRIGIDPRSRTTPTPGFYLGQDTAFRKVDNLQGITEVGSMVKMGPDDIPFGERTEVKPALPDYDISKSLDSEIFRKPPKLTYMLKKDRETSFDIEKRKLLVEQGVMPPPKAPPFVSKKFHYNVTDHQIDDNKSLNSSAYGGNATLGDDPTSYGMSFVSSVTDAFPKRVDKSSIATTPINKNAKKGKKEVNIRYPKLNYRVPPTLKFDRSPYKNLQDFANQSAKARQIPLHPKSLKTEAKIDVFHQYLAIPRSHKGARLPSRVSDKLKRVYSPDHL
jgi:hypothetical protein